VGGYGKVVVGFSVLVVACSDGAVRVESFGDENGGTQGASTGGGPSTTSASGTTGNDGDTTRAADSSDDGTNLDVGFGDVGDPPPTGSCADIVDELSSQGCVFWGVDLPNSRQPAPGGIAEQQQYAVVVANGSPTLAATVRVFVGAEGEPIDEAVVAAENTHTFALPSASIDPTQTTVGGLAYRIESDVPITAYQFNPLQNADVYSNDATVLWPEHVLAPDYTAVTDDATSAAPTYVSIVATENDTEVEVFATTTLAGATPPSATLQRGEVLTVVSVLRDASPPNAGNLSGSRIVADKPVAAFSGNVSAPIIPAGSGWVGGSRICCADHLEHQLIPLQAWGAVHVVATPAPAYYPVDPARYRITGAYDGTTLQWDPAPPPGAPASVDAGQTATFETDLSFIVVSDDTNKPFSITQFLPSGDTSESLFDDERRGDPAMIIIPPREQLEDKYVFAIPSAYALNMLTVVAEDGAALELDGVAIDGPFSALGILDGIDWVYAHVPVDEGTHVMTGSAAFGLTVAGYDVEVSYGFAAGSGFEAISIPPRPPG
jgi:hypothetical protein